MYNSFVINLSCTCICYTYVQGRKSVPLLYLFPSVLYTAWEHMYMYMYMYTYMYKEHTPYALSSQSSWSERSNNISLSSAGRHCLLTISNNESWPHTQVHHPDRRLQQSCTTTDLAAGEGRPAGRGGLEA